MISWRLQSQKLADLQYQFCSDKKKIMQMTIYQTDSHFYPLFTPIVWVYPTNQHLFFMLNEVPYNNGCPTLTHHSILEESTKPVLAQNGKKDKIVCKKKNASIVQRKVQDVKRAIKKHSQITNLSLAQRRNIIPNTVNHILSYLQRKNKSQKFVERCMSKFSKNTQRYSTLQFYSYQLFIKEKLTLFVNKQTLQRVVEHLDSKAPFTLQEQVFYNKIARIVIIHYLQEVSPLVTLNSHRLVQTNRKQHLASQRNLTSCLRSFFKEIKRDSFLSFN